MNCLIVDDEPIACQIVEQYCAELPFINVAAVCGDALQAMEALQRQPVDLMFLDIEMPKLGGFDFLRALAQPPLTVVISAHKEYALEGYELDICDYLLKPFGFERFLRAVERARAQLAGREADAPPERHETLFIKDGKKRRQVKLDDIVRLEACGNYCMVHLVKGRILTQENISDLADRLPRVFVRVHKSHIVAVRRIELIEGGEIAIDGRRIPIGRAFKANVARLLEAR